MSKQPKPDSMSYEDLKKDIKNGIIKIPKFQRNFVWSVDKTAKLLDSLLKGYPIGTFIFWETTERLNEVKNIGNLEIPDAPDGSKVQYVLDGQQRITSLYAAILGAELQKEGEKKITDYKDIFIDLDLSIHSDEQLVTSEKPEGKYISLHKVLNFQDNYDHIESNFDREMRSLINSYSTIFSTYQFSTVVLRKEDIASAIEVFTRINTGGQTLTLFEIMSAKTYDEEQNFDMEEKFQQLLDDLSQSKYNTISSSVLLFIIALVLSENKECKRETILTLDKQKIIDVWDEVISSLKSTIDYFRAVLRIPVSTLLPYDALLVPFSYFFFKNKKKPVGNQVKYLEEFFWRISLAYRYSSAVESKLAQDIKRIDEIIIGKRPNYDDVKLYLNSWKDLTDINFSAGSSICKAILCLYAYYEPKDFRDNGKVILDNTWLKNANSKNYHHFFPKHYLKSKNIGNPNSIINISFVSAGLNKGKINSKAPSVYINEFNEENEELAETLRSHLIDDVDSFGINTDEYSEFLKKRAIKVLNDLENRINLKHKEGKKEEELKELVLSGESDKLEFKSSLRFDLRQNKINDKLEFVVAKTISAFLNAEGGTLLIGVDDDGNAIGIEKDLSTLKKQNIDSFELHLRQIIKKYLSEYHEKYIHINFPDLDNKKICMVKILKSCKPVFVKHEGNESFFVRIGNSSVPKNRQEQSEYEKLHWGS